MRAALLPPLDPELWAGLKQGVLLGAAVLALTLPPTGAASSRLSAPAVAGLPHDATGASFALRRSSADFNGQPASAEAKLVADWSASAGDHGGLPFAILDKRDARVYVFGGDARLVGSSPVLLGAAAGDDSVVGIGHRPISQVRPEERTTPAGRFVSQPGRNASGENVVWVDYGAAVSMHRVRPVDPRERRLERLASDDPSQRRISYGCINVPVAFFESVIEPALGAARAVVYVLPERKSMSEVFSAAAERASFPLPRS
jgi:hypothetical protein